MKLGRFELLGLSDGTFTLDGGQMFGVVPKALWEMKLSADERNRVRVGLTCLLVITGKERVLIETGIGDKFEPKYEDIYGIRRTATLLDDLAKHGMPPEDIDIVINTHLHFDHCGWNTRRDGEKLVATFPRARYFIQRREWEHALAPTERDRASYVEEFFYPAKDRTELLDGNQEIAQGVSLEVVPGHTRDLQCVRIESEGQQAYFISDVVPTRAHLAYPWIMSFDLYPMETLANKKRLLPELVRSRALVVFPHDPELPWARLGESNGRIVPAPVP